MSTLALITAAAPYTAAAGAVLMGVVTVRTTRRNAVDTFAHSRKLAHEQWFWQQRSELYLKLLEVLDHETHGFPTWGPFERFTEARRLLGAHTPTTEIKEVPNLGAMAAAYASNEVLRLWEQRQPVLSQLHAAFNDLAEAMGTSSEEEALAAVEAIEPIYSTATSTLIEQVRCELRTGITETINPTALTKTRG